MTCKISTLGHKNKIFTGECSNLREKILFVALFD